MFQRFTRYPAEVSEHYLGRTAGETAKNHAFRAYSHLCNWGWKPILATTLADRALGTDFTPTTAKVFAGVAFLGASFFYGAFWSKLGTMKDVAKSLRENKKKTLCAIAKNSIMGNVYDPSYMPTLGSDIVYGQVLDTLNHGSPLVRKIGTAAHDICVRTSLAAYAIAR